MRSLKTTLAVLCSLLVVPQLHSQSFNIDFGTRVAVPGDGLGAAARRSGTWNQIGEGGSYALVGLDGNALGVTLTVAHNARFVVNNPATTGDIDALLDDLFNLGAAGDDVAGIEIAGLRSGHYLVYTYAWGPDNPGYRTRVTVTGSDSAASLAGGVWPGGFVESVTHTVHSVFADETGVLVIEAEAAVGWGSLNGLQVVLGLPADDPEWRTINGSNNNVDHPTWGAASTQLLRLTTASYEDGIAEPSGSDRPGPREVSNKVAAQTESRPSRVGATDMFWQWGQFLDHDIDLTPAADPPEPFDIPVPPGDSFFDPGATGDQVIELDRSAYDPESGTDLGDPRQQVNIITSFIDGSGVYGSDAGRASALRTNDGTGRLKTSAGDLLPFNDFGLANAPDNRRGLFAAGDVRANEQVALTTMHTLFVREHNRLAAEIAASDPTLTGEQVYQRARSVVGALMQVITYDEFLPILLGPDALNPYQGYRPEVDPSIANVFSTVVYRLGHSLLSSVLLRMDADGEAIDEGHLALRDAFFAPHRIIDEGGIDPLLRGLVSQLQQDLDPMVVDEVRNFLFGAPGAGGFDLASLNLQRARDHGLPDYNQLRVDVGLFPVQDFAQIGDDPDIQQRLQSIYSDVHQLDPWVGLAESAAGGGMVGETFAAVLIDQFERLRDGDRFWHEEVFSADQLEELKNTRLSDIIRRNTSIGDEIQENVFLLDSAPSVTRRPARPVTFRREPRP